MSKAIVPRSPGDLTPEWLTDALASRHPGTRVVDVELREVREVTNTHAYLSLTYDGPTTAPVRMFAKLPPLDPQRRAVIARSQMGPREIRFYRHLRPLVSQLRVPEVHAAELDDADGSFVLLLDDLEDQGCLVPDGTWGISADAAAVALAELAELHVRFEDPRRRTELASWVPIGRDASAPGLGLLRYGIDHHADKLSERFVASTEVYLEHHAELIARWADGPGPATVVHGDPHLGNLFVDAGRVGFLDWGVINVTTPLRDAGYFITMALQPAERRTHERDLLRHYLDARVTSGGDPIGFDEAWTAHRFHALYCVPAACQIVTFPPDATPRRQVFAAAFLARVEAALDDLDPLGALAELRRAD